MLKNKEKIKPNVLADDIVNMWAVLAFVGQNKTESTAFLGMLWAVSNQSMPREAVDIHRAYESASSAVHIPYKSLTNKAKFKLNILVYIFNIQVS